MREFWRSFGDHRQVTVCDGLVGSDLLVATIEGCMCDDQGK